MLETFPEAGGRLNIHQGKSILLQPWDVAFPLLYARLPFWKDPKLGSWWKLQILWFLASCLTLITMLSLGWCLVASCCNLPCQQVSSTVTLYEPQPPIWPLDHHASCDSEKRQCPAIRSSGKHLPTGHWMSLVMFCPWYIKLEMASSAPTRIEMGPFLVGIGKPHSHTCCAGDFTAAVQSTNVELWVLWYNHSCSFSFGMSWFV